MLIILDRAPLRYINDQDTIVEALPSGTTWNGEKFADVPEEIEADKATPADIRTMSSQRSNVKTYVTSGCLCLENLYLLKAFTERRS